MKNLKELWPRWLKLREAARYASLSPKTIRRLIDEGDLRAERTPGGKKCPGHWRIDRESIDEYFTGDTERRVGEILRSLKN